MIINNVINAMFLEKCNLISLIIVDYIMIYDQYSLILFKIVKLITIEVINI